MTAAVIGAGLSGLAAAWQLAERGCAVTVFDAAARAGGLIGTIPTAHGPVETGANAFVWNDVVAGWFKRLDLEPQFPKPSSKRRYIFRDGTPRRWPLSIGESATLAGRLGTAALTRSLGARDRESMAAWGTRVLGSAATRWLLEPAMQGIYAAPADRLSAAAIFAGRRRGSKGMAAPPGGMGQFTTRLFECLRDRGVRFEFNQRVDRLEAGIPTIVATPAPAAARLLEPHAPGFARAAASVRMSALATATLFFEPRPGDLHGFGMLFPPKSGVHALGVLFNDDIFSGRGAARSERWIVGDRESALTTWDDARLLAALAADRRVVTGRDQPPLAAHITRWPEAIPVYDAAITGVAAAQSALPPWLGVAGNYLGRIGVAALLSIAEDAANRVAL